MLFAEEFHHLIATIVQEANLAKYLRCKARNHGMKQLLPFIFMLILPLPVLAGISVEADKHFYNFGDSIVASYVVSADSDFSGLARLSLVCSNSSMDFYALPTSLFAGESQSVTVPGLAVVQAMAGRCYIEANASSFDKTLAYSFVSSVFNVTGNLPVSVSSGKSLFLPGGEMSVSGSVVKSHASKATVVLSFLGDTYSSPVVNNSFSYRLVLPAGIKSGRHSLGFSVNDLQGNSGSSSLYFEVEAVPTKLLLSLSNRTALPGDVVKASVGLADQGGDAMNRQASISLVDNAGSIILQGSDSTPSVFRLELPPSLPPGTYSVKASSLGLTASSMIFVETVEGISLSFDDRLLTVVNSGNVDYSKELIVTLGGSKKQLVLSQELELKPGQSTVIDLYKEVPEDDYNITFPGVSGAPSFGSHLKDERSLVRKASDFMGITGRVVPQTGTSGIQTITTPLILVIIVSLLVFFFSRNRRKPSVDRSYDEEAEALKRCLDEKRQQKQTSGEEEMQLPPGLSRDDESVRKFMENMRKEKQI